MVCETKIVAAEDHEALPGAKKDALLAAAGAMWPPLPAAPPPGPQPLGGAGGAGPPGGRGLCIREFRAAEQEAARRIFYDGIMERIPNTAFRGLRQHPRTQLLYALLAGQCAGPCRSPRAPAPPGTHAPESPRLARPTSGASGRGEAPPPPRARTDTHPRASRILRRPGRGGLQQRGLLGPGLRAGERRGLHLRVRLSVPFRSPGWGRVTAGSAAAEAPRLARVTIYNPRGGGGCLGGSKC